MKLSPEHGLEERAIYTHANSRRLLISVATLAVLSGCSLADEIMGNEGRAEPASPPPVETVAPEQLERLTSVDANQLWEEFIHDHPDLEMPEAAPAIWPSAEASQRVVDMAYGRGYRLQPSIREGASVRNIVDHDGTPTDSLMLAEAAEAFEALDSAVPFTLYADNGFRSDDVQRETWLSVFINQGGSAFSIEDIEGGLADDVIHKTLDIAAPPGMSTHRSGLAVDYGDINAQGILSSGTTTTLREHGWILLYPDEQNVGGARQENWHLVYVGRDLSMRGPQSNSQEAG